MRVAIYTCISTDEEHQPYSLRMSQSVRGLAQIRLAELRRRREEIQDELERETSGVVDPGLQRSNQFTKLNGREIPLHGRRPGRQRRPGQVSAGRGRC